jgi:hypothetical protein
MTLDTSGRELPEPSAFYDPATSCWRMSGGMFPSDSMPSLATLPTWGTTVAGALYELPTPALPTGEPESSLLLPTPVVNDMGAGKTVERWDEWTASLKMSHGNGNGHGPSLSIEALRLFPTPTCSDTNGAGEHGTGGPDLRTVLSLLPTPRATDGTKGGPNQRGSKGDLMLPSAVMLLPTPKAASGGPDNSKTRPSGAKGTTNLAGALLPTPTSRDHKGANQRRDSSCLHGALTNRPSDAGKPCADQLPGQLSLDEPASA